MDLTVCLCVRDGEVHLDRCLRALLADTEGSNVAIVVVDHLSRDRTPQLLARWHEACPGRLDSTRFTGEGLAAARDYAWRLAKTEWVAFVDVDCEVQPGWTAAATDAIRTLGADPDAGAIGGVNRVPGGGPWLYAAYAILLSGYVGGHDSILNRSMARRRAVDHCPTLNVLYRRAALAAVDGFDAAYTRVCEDVELSRRLSTAGWSLWVAPELVVEHALRPTLPGWLRNVFLYGRGRMFHLKRHPQEWQAKFLAPPAVTLLYAAALFGGLIAGGELYTLCELAMLHAMAVAALLAGPSRRRGEGLVTWATATVVTCLTHLAFGAGMMFECPRRSERFVL